MPMADTTEGRRSRAVAVLQPFLLGLGAWLLPVSGVALILFAVGCPYNDACTFGWSAEVFIAAIVVILLLEVGAGFVAARIGVIHGTLRASVVAGAVGALGASLPMVIMSGPLVGASVRLDDAKYSLPLALAVYVGYRLYLRVRLPRPSDDLERFY
jgi:hypothetical protein